MAVVLVVACLLWVALAPRVPGGVCGREGVFEPPLRPASRELQAAGRCPAAVMVAVAPRGWVALAAVAPVLQV